MVWSLSDSGHYISIELNQIENQYIKSPGKNPKLVKNVLVTSM